MQTIQPSTAQQTFYTVASNQQYQVTAPSAPLSLPMPTVHSSNSRGSVVLNNASGFDSLRNNPPSIPYQNTSLPGIDQNPSMVRLIEYWTVL